MSGFFAWSQTPIIPVDPSAPVDPGYGNPIGGGPGPGPKPPLGIWGPGDPRPTNPIAGFDPIHGTFPPGVVGPPILPVDPGYSPPWAQVPPTPPAPDLVTWKTGWTADQGWVVVGIVVPQGPHPTPSK